MIRIGSMFSCAGGLDLAALSVLGGQVVWHAEIDPAGCKVLAHRWPDVPNLGDVAGIDFAEVESVDILTAGFPCQDVSLAGRRAGVAAGTRSGLWSEVVRALDVLRPELVVLENVRGLLSARADSAMEPCPWCLGDNPDEPALRALGAVLGDLASLGFDAEWMCLPASSVGAPHRRERVFVLAWPAADADGFGQVRAGAAWGWRAGSADHDLAPSDAGAPVVGLDHATAADAAGPGWGPLIQVDVCGHGAASVRPREAEPGRRDSAVVDASGVGRSQGRPEPTRQFGGSDAAQRGDAAPVEWGIYGPAIRRWESVIGRPAPAPTVTGARGGRQLSARFVEFMMGLPDGWVTDVPGVSRNDALRLLGGMVVPQQGAVALRELLFRAGFGESLGGAA